MQNNEQCINCGDTFPASDAQYLDNDGDIICETCRFDDYFDCNYCDELFPTDEIIYTHDTEETLCQGCCDYHAEYCERTDEYYINGRPNDIIHEYSYKPDTLFHFIRWNKTNPPPDLMNSYGGGSRLYAGVEIEVENTGTWDTEETAERLLDEMKSRDDSTIYCKEDGSISEGFEIVSQPRTWSNWKRSFDIFQPVFDLTEYGFQSHNTDSCGLHVSLSRRAFRPAHLMRFQKLIYFNPDFIRVLSRRKLGNLLQWGNPYATTKYLTNLNKIESDYQQTKNGDWLTERAEKRLEKEHYETPFYRNQLGGFFVNHKNESIYTSRALSNDRKNGRGTAVNLTGDRVECRFFRGTLKKETFKMNLEFCFFAFDFSKDTNTEAMTVQNMRKYAQKHGFKRVYSFLDGIPWGTREKWSEDFKKTVKSERVALAGSNPTITGGV